MLGLLKLNVAKDREIGIWVQLKIGFNDIKIERFVQLIMTFSRL